MEFFGNPARRRLTFVTCGHGTASLRAVDTGGIYGQVKWYLWIFLCPSGGCNECHVIAAQAAKCESLVLHAQPG